MIADNNEAGEVIAVDLGWPDLSLTDYVESWEYIHNWIKTSDTPVYVVGSFYDAERHIAGEEVENRASYCVWVNTQADAVALNKAVHAGFNTTYRLRYVPPMY